MVVAVNVLLWRYLLILQMGLKFQLLCNYYFEPKYNIGAMLGTSIDIQCCLSIVSILAPNVWSDVATTLPEHCLNIHHQHWRAALPQCSLNVVSMMVTNFGEQCCHKVHTTLPERCLSVSDQCWGAMLPQCSHKIA